MWTLEIFEAELAIFNGYEIQISPFVFWLRRDWYGMKDDQYRFLALAGQLPAPREAWEMGLDGESSVYPSVPLLEQWVHGSER